MFVSVEGLVSTVQVSTATCGLPEVQEGFWVAAGVSPVINNTPQPLCRSTLSPDINPLSPVSKMRSLSPALSLSLSLLCEVTVLLNL